MIDDLTTELPSDLEAEQALLGALLQDNTMLDQIGELEGTDFYQPAHEQVWYAIGAVIETGAQAEPITVAAELKRRGELGPTGGALALFAMLEAGDVALNAPVYARMIREHAIQRRLIQATIKIRQMAASGTAEAAELLRAARDAIADLGDGGQDDLEQDTLHEALAEVVDGLGAPTPAAGLDTPWPDLNEYLMGLAPGRLYVIGARPAVGKSLMAQGLAVHWARRHRQHALLASMEMRKAELTRRVLAQASGVSLTTLNDSRHITTADRDAVERASAVVLDELLPRLHILDRGEQSAASISATARAMHKRGELSLLVVDYLQLLQPAPTLNRTRNREQEVAESSRAFKRLAMDLEIPVVVLSQLNRSMLSRADRRPTMGDVRESGAIEQDADVIILLHQPEPDDSPWDLEVIVDKNRSGRKGTLRLVQQGWIANLGNRTHGYSSERPAA